MLVVGDGRAEESDGDLLSGGDIRCPADDVESFGAHVDVTDRQAIGLRMFLTGGDAADDESVERGGQVFESFHFQSRHREIFREPLGGPVDVDEFLQPG